MSNDLNHTSKIDVSKLKERINIRFKAARAEEERAYTRMNDEWEQNPEASRVEYVYALGKQAAFESIMMVIDNFSYGSSEI